MKKTINLLRHRKKSSIPSIYLFIRNIALVGAVISFIIFVFINGRLFKVTKINNDLLQQKKTLLEDIISQKDNEAKINYFKVKSDQFEAYSKENADFKPLYFLLKDSFSEASTSSIIKELSIDNKKNFTFRIYLESFEKFADYINNITTPKYIKLFNVLNVSDFSYEGNKSYSLVFSGSLK